MKKTTLKRIFAYIGLAGMVGVVVFSILYFFNMFNDYSTPFGTLTVIFICVAAVFFILAKYIIRVDDNKEPLEDGEDGEWNGKSPDPATVDGEADNGENNVDPADDKVPDEEPGKSGEPKKD